MNCEFNAIYAQSGIMCFRNLNLSSNVIPSVGHIRHAISKFYWICYLKFWKHTINSSTVTQKSLHVLKFKPSFFVFWILTSFSGFVDHCVSSFLVMTNHHYVFFMCMQQFDQILTISDKTKSYLWNCLIGQILSPSTKEK